MARELGYIHPDQMLQCMTSKQVGQWIAYCRLIGDGPPLPPDPKAKQKQQRAKFEEGMRGLMIKGEKHAKR